MMSLWWRRGHRLRRLGLTIGGVAVLTVAAALVTSGRETSFFKSSKKTVYSGYREKSFPVVKFPAVSTGPEAAVKRISSSTTARGILGTPTCHIPDFHPFDASLVPALKGSLPFCTPPPLLTYRNGSRVEVNSSLSSNIPNFSHCEVRGIRKAAEDSDQKFYTTAPAFKFRESVFVRDEFVVVTCFNASSRHHPFFTNFHAFVHEDDDKASSLRARWSSIQREKSVDPPGQQQQPQPQPQQPLSVVLIGIDSTSRLNALRFLNNTRRVLSRSRSFVEMDLHNKVGENTFPNVFRLLSGRYRQDFVSFYNRTQGKGPYDEIPFLWKQFQSSGYVTLYAEDWVHQSSFEFGRKGFKKPPTDYYNVFANYPLQSWDIQKECYFRPQETNWVLDYLSQFVQKFTERPLFAFTFLTKLTHSSCLGAKTMDTFLSQTFKAGLDSGAFDNSLLIVFGDHGSRYDLLRQTEIGSFEDRLPFMSLSFPTWFQKQYPSTFARLRKNGRQLTSHFDIYETLRDVLAFGQGLYWGEGALQSGEALPANARDDFGTVVSRGYSVLEKRNPDLASWRSPYGISLFREIPADRTCSAAGVPDNWCGCLGDEGQVDNATRIAEAFVESVNAFLDKFGVKELCARLRLAELLSIKRLLSLERDNATRAYRLVVTTRPGGGLFEALVRVSTRTGEPQPVEQDNLSRINEYGKQAACAPIPFVEKMCYCKQGRA